MVSYIFLDSEQLLNFAYIPKYPKLNFENSWFDILKIKKCTFRAHRMLKSKTPNGFLHIFGFWATFDLEAFFGGSNYPPPPKKKIEHPKDFRDLIGPLNQFFLGLSMLGAHP